MKYEDFTKDMLRDKNVCCEYLNITLKDSIQTDDFSCFYLALKNIVLANGGFENLSLVMGVSRTSLYKTLSGKSSPSFFTILRIIRHLNMKLEILSK